MEVTDVRVRKVDKEGKMKAIVSITFDEEFVIHDIKVIEGEKGLFIAMPSRKTTDGFGLGFERAVMYITGMSNIRDVLPFPRTVGNCEL